MQEIYKFDQCLDIGVEGARNDKADEDAREKVRQALGQHHKDCNQQCAAACEQVVTP
jgi:hypothetical protein